MNSQQLWDTLKKQQLVMGDKPDDDHVTIPWYIRFMQGFAGWLAAFFILGFCALFFSFIFDTKVAGLVIAMGVMVSVIGYTVIKSSKSDFINQLGMAFSLAGQLLFLFGLILSFKNHYTTIALIMGIYQLLLAWLIPQYAHRLLSTLFGLIALLIAFNANGYYGIGSALVAILFGFIWLKENQWGKMRDKWEPIGFGTALTLVFSSSFLITGKFIFRETFRSNSGWLFTHAEIISSLLIALLLLNLVVLLLKEYKIKWDSRTSYLSLLAAISLVLMSYKIHGLSTGLLILLVGFARQRIVLMVLGATAMVGFFSWYYYNLDWTLLYKSMLLIGMGVAALIAWFGLNKCYHQAVQKQAKPFKLSTPQKNQWLAIVAVILTLIVINFQINQKLNLIDTGEKLIFPLAPIDPRAIMQGDYMRLRFDLGIKILKRINLANQKINPQALHGLAVVNKDDNDVVSFVDLYHHQALNKNQRLIPYQYKRYQIVFSTDAFYFQEGQASHFQQAKYGEFRYSKNGELILVHLLDKDFKVL